MYNTRCLRTAIIALTALCSQAGCGLLASDAKAPEDPPSFLIDPIAASKILVKDNPRLGLMPEEVDFAIVTRISGAKLFLNIHQGHRGVRVIDGAMQLLVDSTSHRILAIRYHDVKPIDRSTSVEPTLTAAEAVEIAAREFHAVAITDPSDPLRNTEIVGLGVQFEPDGPTTRLVWRIEVFGSPSTYFRIDAHTGQVVYHFDH
jgi:hypothetical protein